MRTPLPLPRTAFPGLLLLALGLLVAPLWAAPLQGQDSGDLHDPNSFVIDLELFSDPTLLEQIACIRETLDGDWRMCTWSEGIEQCRSDTYDAEARCLLESSSFLDRAECRLVGILDELACLPGLGWILDAL